MPTKILRQFTVTFRRNNAHSSTLPSVTFTPYSVGPSEPAPLKARGNPRQVNTLIPGQSERSEKGSRRTKRNISYEKNIEEEVDKGTAMRMTKQERTPGWILDERKRGPMEQSIETSRSTGISPRGAAHRGTHDMPDSCPSVCSLYRAGPQSGLFRGEKLLAVPIPDNRIQADLASRGVRSIGSIKRTFRMLLHC